MPTVYIIIPIIVLSNNDRTFDLSIDENISCTYKNEIFVKILSIIRSLMFFQVIILLKEYYHKKV